MSNTKVNTGLTLRDLNQGDKFRFKSDPETRVRRLSQKGKIEGYCPYDGQNTMGHSMSSGDEVYFLGEGDIILINDELKVNTEERELFTPGAWGISPQRTSFNEMVLLGGDNGKYLIATIPDCSYTPAQNEANAKLIASAPDLYNALKDLIKWHHEHNAISFTDEQMITKGVAALLKANPNYKP